MNQFLHGVVRACAGSFDLPGPILEVGAYQVAGQETLADLRSLFPGRAYLGTDARPGPGVERVVDVECLPFPDASFGTVLALNIFEHVAHFWRGFAEISRVLRPDGALLVSCPFYFHIHNHPGDYWRFTPSALELLLEDYPSKILGWQGERTRPLHVWALAFQADHAPVTEAQFSRYQELLGLHAREPLASARCWRYWLGQLLCGRRPFAPYLEQNRWETVCLPQPMPANKPLFQSPRLIASHG